MLIQRGEAIEIHVAAHTRAAKRGLRAACQKVVDWIPHAFPWCRMLIATVRPKSVYNLCKKVGFADTGKVNDIHIMVVPYELCW